MKLVHYQLIPVNLKKKVTYPDGKASGYSTRQRSLKPSRCFSADAVPEQRESAAGRKIGTLGDLKGTAESPLCADQHGGVRPAAQMARTNAGFRRMSGGGIRDSIEGGDITYKDVLKVRAVWQTVVYAVMSGRR